MEFKLNVTEEGKVDTAGFSETATAQKSWTHKRTLSLQFRLYRDLYSLASEESWKKTKDVPDTRTPGCVWDIFQQVERKTLCTSVVVRADYHGAMMQ